MFVLQSVQSALPDGSAIAMVRAILTEVHTQSQAQTERHRVFSILLHFLRTRLKGWLSHTVLTNV